MWVNTMCIKKPAFSAFQCSIRFAFLLSLKLIERPKGEYRLDGVPYCEAFKCCSQCHDAVAIMLKGPHDVCLRRETPGIDLVSPVLKTCRFLPLAVYWKEGFLEIEIMLALPGRVCAQDPLLLCTCVHTWPLIAPRFLDAEHQQETPRPKQFDGEITLMIIGSNCWMYDFPLM